MKTPEEKKAAAERMRRYRASKAGKAPVEESPAPVGTELISHLMGLPVAPCGQTSDLSEAVPPSLLRFISESVSVATSKLDDRISSLESTVIELRETLKDLKRKPRAEQSDLTELPFSKSRQASGRMGR